MKRISVGLLMWMAVCSLQAQERQYRIEGTAPEKDGTWVYLGEDKKMLFDSVQVSCGVFSMSGPLADVRPVVLTIGKVKQPFLLDEHPVQVEYTTEKRMFRGKEVEQGIIAITGDHDQELLKTMNATLTRELISMFAISLAGNEGDLTDAKRDSLGQIYVSARAYTKQVFDSIVNNFPDSYVSAIIINDRFAKERPATEIEQLYNRLSDRVKSEAPGKTLQKTVAAMKAVGIGSIAPDFTLADPDGKRINLSSLRGKRCVLIDFWASWCGPCIRELPNVKKVYEQFHGKGFEVISVSLDDKRDNWMRAIEKHQLPWIHVSSLQGWKCPVVQLYQVSGVPAMFLLDSEGRIVSDNARGEALEREVARLCNE